jgi:hypothetical protein
MQTLKDLIKSDQEKSRIISRWESDAAYRKERLLSKHLSSLNKYVGNHIALHYYLLDNHVVMKGDGKMSLFEALTKLKLLKAIRKAALKDEEDEKLVQLDPIIREYEKRIETKIKQVKLIKPST